MHLHIMSDAGTNEGADDLMIDNMSCGVPKWLLATTCITVITPLGGGGVHRVLLRSIVGYE